MAKTKAKKSRKPIVLITGVGGFVGHHAVKEAVSAGYRVRATDVPRADLSFLEGMKDVEIAYGDITVRSDVKKLVKGVDYVVHIAAIFNLAAPKELLMAVNYRGTAMLAEEAAKAKVKHFVFCSTLDIYGVPKQIPATEDMPAAPENYYAYTKSLGELEVFRIGESTSMPVTAVRPTAIYGSWGVYTAGMFFALPFILERRLKALPKLVGGPLVNMVNVEDVAGSLIYVLGKKKTYGRPLLIADDSHVPLGQLINGLCDALKINRSPLVIPIPKRPFVAFAKVLNRLLSPDSLDGFNERLQSSWQKIVLENKLKPVLNPRFDYGFLSYGLGDHAYDNSAIKAVGYKLRHPDLFEGFKKTADWYRAQGWIPKR